MIFDLLIKGGDVIDGTGAPRRESDVAIAGDRIVAIAPSIPCERAVSVINAEGSVVAPGFIDMHAHSELILLREPTHDAKLRQGVTLEVLGQDGLSYAPTSKRTLEILERQLLGWHGPLPGGFGPNGYSVRDFMSRFDRSVSVNVAYLVPHGNLRLLITGSEDRTADMDEIAKMQNLLHRGMEDGAVGMSTGLTYPPAMFSSDEEIELLCESLADAGGYYCPHHRNYGSRALESYRDSIDIASRAGCGLHLAHTHMSFPRNRGRARDLLAMIDEALGSGVDVSFDSYPYLAGATYLHSLLPRWFQSGGPAEVSRRLSDETCMQRAQRELEVDGSDGFQGVPVDWSKVLISGVQNPSIRHLVGKSISEVAVELDLEPIQAYRDVLLTDDLGTSCLLFMGDEENVRTIMSHPAHTGGSDAILVGERPHPRGWGTFPRYLGRYAREEGIFSLEECVKHLTFNAARRLGLSTRGSLQEGHYADVVVFDPLTVSDRATYENPKQYPDGIQDVIVNGVITVRGGEHTGATSGRWIKAGDR